METDLSGLTLQYESSSSAATAAAAAASRKRKQTRVYPKYSGLTQ
jgi:hypothetical protein